jgi:hypothetical protein
VGIPWRTIFFARVIHLHHAALGPPDDIEYEFVYRAFGAVQ